MSKLPNKPKQESAKKETDLLSGGAADAKGGQQPTKGDQQPGATPPKTNDPVSIGQESNQLTLGASAIAGGAAAGALGAAVGGPAGAAVGSTLGALAGGLGARTLSEAVAPSFEVDFWADECTRRDYYDPQVGPEPFLVAYRIGFENYDPKSKFEDLEQKLKAQWEATEAAKRISWSQAKSAMHDAWTRVSSQYSPPNDSAS